ncbi:MAG: FkbM family methyltransferase [Bacteroidota bacterium]|nr:FkbM family methyltransferase [Bacteroidota bacterium]
MSFIHYIKKPEYFLKPISIFKRLFKKNKGVSSIKTPWHSTIEIDCSDMIGREIYKTGIYDLAVSELLWRLVEPGNFVIDIGANIGFFTNLCSYRTGKSGKVWAFEPNPSLQTQLKKNGNSNDLLNTTFFQIALSDSTKEGFLVLPDHYNNNNGVAFIGNDSKSSLKISLKCLDDIISTKDRIEVLKIDVEGHELAVFTGAQEALQNKCVENIIFEDHNPYPSKVILFLQSFGYKIYRIEKGWRNIILKDPTSKSRISTREPTNYLATFNVARVRNKIKGGFYKCMYG